MKYLKSLFAAFWLRPKANVEWNNSNGPLLNNFVHRGPTVTIISAILKPKALWMSSSDMPGMRFFQGLSFMTFDKESFSDSSLQMAVEIFNEAQTMVRDGNHQKACEEFQSALFIGRKVVQKLQESEDESTDDDPRLALEWLIASYLSMFQCRVALGDWNKARADAWAACNYAQYGPNGSFGGDGMDAQSFQLELAALSAMWIVCQNTNDTINEWQTLQSLQKLLKLPFPEKAGISITREQVEERIQILADELEAK